MEDIFKTEYGQLIIAPLQLAIAVLIVLLVVATVSRVVNRLARRGGTPVVFSASAVHGHAAHAHDEASIDRQQHDEEEKALVARVRQYSTKDSGIVSVHSPGGAEAAGPGVSAREPHATPEGLMSSLMTIPVGGRRAYNVHIQLLDAPNHRVHASSRHPEPLRAGVEIVLEPKDRVIASFVAEKRCEDDLVEEIGCLCCQHIGNEREFLRRTPRWERWNPNGQAYRSYRKGLEAEQRALGFECGKKDRYLRKALHLYDDGIRREPGNLLLHSRKGQLYELMATESRVSAGPLGESPEERYNKAIYEYGHSRELWPERIEDTYRLAVAMSNYLDIMHEPQKAEEVALLDEVGRDLRYPALLKNLLRTCLPWRWNTGERQYWESWLKSDSRGGLGIGHRRRHHYLAAVAMVRCLAQLKRLKRSIDANESYAGPNGPLQEVDAQNLERILDEFVEQISRERPRHSDGRVEVAPHAGHPYLKRRFAGRVHKRGLGWLAHFNAACFFSLLMEFGERSGDPERWKRDCEQAAVYQLGLVVRDPTANIKPLWMENDPDLKPLRESGTEWAEFAGQSSHDLEHCEAPPAREKAAA